MPRTLISITPRRRLEPIRGTAGAERQGVIPSALRPMPRREWRRLREYSSSESGKNQGSDAGRNFLVHHPGRRTQRHALLGHSAKATTVADSELHSSVSAPTQLLADLPGNGSHSTRDIQFSLDGRKMFVSVGSVSNVDDPDTTPGERNRADVLEFNPDGSEMHVYAYGIRNCVGLAVNSKT